MTRYLGSHPSRIGLPLFVLASAVACATFITPALAEDGTFLLAQTQSQDQDRDRDREPDQDRDRDRDHDGTFTDADRDRLMTRLKTGNCAVAAKTTGEVLLLVMPCLDEGPGMGAMCLDRIELGIDALERTRLLCGG